MTTQKDQSRILRFFVPVCARLAGHPALDTSVPAVRQRLADTVTRAIANLMAEHDANVQRLGGLQPISDPPLSSEDASMPSGSAAEVGEGEDAALQEPPMREVVEDPLPVDEQVFQDGIHRSSSPRPDVLAAAQAHSPDMEGGCEHLPMEYSFDQDNGHDLPSFDDASSHTSLSDSVCVIPPPILVPCSPILISSDSDSSVLLSASQYTPPTPGPQPPPPPHLAEVSLTEVCSSFNTEGAHDVSGSSELDRLNRGARDLLHYCQVMGMEGGRVVRHVSRDDYRHLVGVARWLIEQCSFAPGDPRNQQGGG